MRVSRAQARLCDAPDCCFRLIVGVRRLPDSRLRGNDGQNQIATANHCPQRKIPHARRS